MSAIRLTPEQVSEIREAYLNPGPGGASQATLATRYGVSIDTIRSALKGRHPSGRGLPDISNTRTAFLDRAGWGWTDR